MSFVFKPFHPPSNLGGLVRQSFLAQGRITYRTDKILPNGLISLLFTLGNPHRVGKDASEDRNREFGHSWLSGLQTTPLYHTPVDGTHVLGVLFEPPGFNELFDVDMVDLQDKTVDSRDVLPENFIRFVSSLYERADDFTAHEALFEWLAAQERRGTAQWVFDFHGEVAARRGNVILDHWYEASGHSSRHAINLFRRATGVTPKVLCRIHRLLALLEAIEPAEDVQWTALAHEYGFFDQSHFNHEFRKLSGLHPGEYLAQRRRDLPDLGQGESVSFAPQR